MTTRIIVIRGGWPGLAAVMAMRPCVVCGEPVDLEVAHFAHHPSCPNLITGVEVICECDMPCHPACCPNCQAGGEQLYDALVDRALGLDGENRP